MDTTYPFYCIGGKDHRWQATNEGYYQWASSGTEDKTPPENALYFKKQQCIDCLAVRYVICSGGQVMEYTPKQLEYVRTVDNPHMSAVRIIGELKADVEKLKKDVAFWEAKANEYKALLENMERVG